MSRRSSWPVVAVGVVAVALLGAGILLRWLARAREPHRPGPAPVASAPTPHAAADHASRAAPPFDPGSHGSAKDDDGWNGDPLALPGYPQGSWENVDMEAIRAALPDNLYWKLAAPTKDPEVLREREERRDRWNVEYGKVLSNTATPAEIDAYYAERQRMSEDYLEFIVYLLTNYGYEIPARDVALLKLSAEMHHQRLEEIPRQITEARQRQVAHEAARQKWLEDQKAFEGEAPGPP